MSDLTILQFGQYNTSSGVWTASFFGLVNIGAPFQVWLQVDKAVPLTQAITALVDTMLPSFTEDGTLTMYTMPTPVLADFATTTNPPTGAVVFATADVSFASVPLAVDVPLSDRYGKANMLHAQMRSRGRAATGGGYRFALGFAFSGTGGTMGNDSLALTGVDEFTGWGGHRGTAGVDRAVRCPRCGTVMKEAELVQDGYTRGDVCPQCYDPDPAAEPRWRWPFRG